MRCLSAIWHTILYRLGLAADLSGLTCSTLVAAVLRSAGRRLIWLRTWPAQASVADVAARQWALDQWRQLGQRYPQLATRADEIEPSIRTRRVSPEQVAGACLQRR